MAAAPPQANPGTAVPEGEFRRLYDAELPYVFRSLRRLGVGAAELEDLAHDVFVVVHRRWADRDPARPVRPWLFGIAANTAARALDRAFRRHEVPARDGAVEDPGSSSGTQQEARDLLLRALATLDFDQRVAVVMHDLDGHSAVEIAAIVGIPVNTVYSRLRLGRQRLAAAVRAIEGEKP